MELHEEYQSLLDLDAQVIAISAEHLSLAETAVEQLGLQFPALYDLDEAVSQQYQVYGLLNKGMTTPATFLLDKEGRVRWQYVGNSHTDKPALERILAELESLGGGGNLGFSWENPSTSSGRTGWPFSVIP